MKVALLEIKNPGDNKDFNGGFGTTFEIGRSYKSKILAFARRNLEKTPTLSYAYISAIFKKYGHKVDYYENKAPNNPEGYDLCLMHVSLIRHNEEAKLIDALKEKKQCKIGVYGPLATVQPELFNNADIIIVGEPEEAVINMAKSGRIKKGKIKSSPIKDLDELPFPDWSIFSLKDFSLSPLINTKPAIFVHASRGCPYGCNYCPYKVFGTYRQRKPEKVVRELKHLKEKYNIKSFYFRDPTFSIGQERIEKLANLIIKEKLNLKWGCETRVDLLTIPLLKLLHSSGLRCVKLGVESIDHNMLNSYGRKPPQIEKQEEIVKFCKKIGIKVVAFYIIGLPSDTRESILSTIKYAHKLNTSFANFTICTPIPGTYFYNSIKGKIFEKNLNKFDNFHAVFNHEHLSKEEIYSLQDKAITSYYFRFRYVGRYLLDKLAERK